MPARRIVRATGVSRRMSFDEALADAVTNLPPSASNTPRSIQVTKTRVEQGGVVGTALYVEVKTIQGQ